MNNIYDIALSLTPRVGGQTAAYLIEQCHTAEKIFSMSYEELRAINKLNSSVANDIVNRVAFPAAERQLRHCERYNIKAISLNDSEYPPLLRECYAPPYVIYVEGDLSIFRRNLVSMVGTRKITHYGEMVCERLVEEMAHKIEGLVTVSGLAYGVDAAIHRHSLEAGIPTIAVLPCALPAVQPVTHRAMARDIVASGGALISEYHCEAKCGKTSFVARNRVIAGLSAATIVVESSTSGGGLLTAQFASDESRALFAVPGRIYDESSAGCNKLIKSLAALPISSAEDIIANLNWDHMRRKEVSYAPLFGVEGAITPEREGGYPDSPAGFDRSQLSEVQLNVVRSMSSNDPLQVEVISKLCGLSTQQLNVTLMELELMGVVKAIPGARYMRNVAISSLYEE